MCEISNGEELKAFAMWIKPDDSRDTVSVFKKEKHSTSLSILALYPSYHLM